MKKYLYIYPLIFALCLCGCVGEKNKKETRFLFDTVVTITADCDSEVISGAFSLCNKYDNLLSRTNPESEIYKLNNSSGSCETDSEVLNLIENSLYFSQISNGKFDITLCSVSELWDFKNQIIPSKSEIAEALKNVDYQSIEIIENKINPNGKKIDLGAVAKGYIADRVKEYLIKNGAKNAIINLGGNVVVLGKEYKIGIKKPFEDTNAAVLNLSNKSVVTSGIYERYIEQNGEIYHHILDKNTGYGVNNELASVTVISDSSFLGDALSTTFLLSGKKEALQLLKLFPETEVVFIEKNGEITLSSGLYEKNNVIYLK